MRIPLTRSAVPAMVMLAMTLVAGSGAGAQDGASVDLQPGDLEGIRYGVTRIYHVEATAAPVTLPSRPGESTPTPEATPSIPSGVISLGGGILEFDSAENAKSALDHIHDAVRPEILGVGADVLELGPGDAEFSYAWTEDFDDRQLDAVVTLVLDEQYVYLVTASGSGQDMQAIVSDFANTLIENEGSGEGEFHADGTSSGGLWDKFPAADDELVAGLLLNDGVVFPEPAATPEASVPCGCTPPPDAGEATGTIGPGAALS